jgi:hypothetical protein
MRKWGQKQNPAMRLIKLELTISLWGLCLSRLFGVRKEEGMPGFSLERHGVPPKRGV